MATDINLRDIEPQIEVLKQVNINTVHKMLERAARKAETARRHQASATKHAATGTSHLAKALESAMAFHGRSAKNRPSIRMKAPDTGGRPYHFGFTTVTKGTRKKARGAESHASRPGGGGAGEKKPTPSQPAGRGRNRASTREGAHQIYTEREAAVEKDGKPLDERWREFTDLGNGAGPIPGIDGEQKREPEGPGPSADRAATAEPSTPAQRAQEWVQEETASVPGLSERSSEAAAQVYIEDAAKMPRLRGRTTSFGTIGETLEERLKFWELVHEHESEKGGRTQSRLVLELPHEASADERHEIVRRYTDEMFRKKGLPYWVSIHEPTKGNDWRNHHAHAVFTDRPMQKMINPTTGEEAWDFTIAETYKKKSRNIVTHYPYRQNRDPEMRDRGWVRRARARFSEITNEVMERSGNEVRYDPRSYKDMGLDVAPMKHVNRIIADKTKSQQFVVMDAEWTRKMIDEEIKDAAIRRDATFRALVRTEQRLVETARGAAHLAKTNDRLPPHLRMGPGRLAGTRLGSMVVTRLLKIERERLVTKFVDEATERTLKHVIEATTVARQGKRRSQIHDPKNHPDPEDLRTLNEAAREELAEHHRQTRLSGIIFGAQFEDVRRIWNGGPGIGPTSPEPFPDPNPRAPRFWERGKGREQAQTPTPRPARHSPSTDLEGPASTTARGVTTNQGHGLARPSTRLMSSTSPEPVADDSRSPARVTARDQDQGPIRTATKLLSSANSEPVAHSGRTTARHDLPATSNAQHRQSAPRQSADHPKDLDGASQQSAPNGQRPQDVTIPTWRWDDPAISRLSNLMREALPGPDTPPEKIREAAEARLRELAAITRATQALMNRVESEDTGIAPRTANKSAETRPAPAPAHREPLPIHPKTPSPSSQPHPDPPRRIERVISRRLSTTKQTPSNAADPAPTAPVAPKQTAPTTHRPQPSANSRKQTQPGATAPTAPRQQPVQPSLFDEKLPAQPDSRTSGPAQNAATRTTRPNKDPKNCGRRGCCESRPRSEKTAPQSHSGPAPPRWTRPLAT
jgi:hypothetical protein